MNYFFKQSLIFSLLLIVSPNIYSNPKGGTILSGEVVIQNNLDKQNKLNIIQTTEQAFINWEQFNIDVNEHTHFQHISANSVTLNRIMGNDPSKILGRLTANGQIMLINQNGILFGKNAKVDASSLVASVHDIKDTDFLNKNYKFHISGNSNAPIINKGNISVADTGIVVLAAPAVHNYGTISAKIGKVAMVVSNEIIVDFHGDQLIRFQIDKKVAQVVQDFEGNKLDSLIENTGTIKANGGSVLLSTNAALGIVNSVINHTGIIEAQTVSQENGEIILDGGEYGGVSIAGTLDASAPKSGNGGFIETSGRKVKISKEAIITTKSEKGKDGTWLIDPEDYTIAASGGDITGATISDNLAQNNIIIETVAMGTGNGDIFVNDEIKWSSDNSLTLQAHHNINVNQLIESTGNADVKLKADNAASGDGTVIFSGNGKVDTKGTVEILYNPDSYDAPTDYTPNVFNCSKLITHMFVHDINDLQNIHHNPKANYILTKDIDASATGNGNWSFNGFGFMSIKNFEGILDGNGKSITNLYSKFGGLFDSILSKGYVKNVKLVDINIEHSDILKENYHYKYGGLANKNNGYIYNSHVTSGSIQSMNYYVGGLVGYNAGSIVNSSANLDTIIAGNDISYVAYVGGLVGINTGEINNSSSSSNITGIYGSYYGGLVGYNSHSIFNSFATGTVVAQEESHNAFYGGFVGYNSNEGGIFNSYALGNTGGGNINGGFVGENNGVILYSYSYGIVNDPFGSTSSGGFAGINTNTIDSSYWDHDRVPLSSSGGTGLSSDQMQQISSYTNWDISDNEALSTWFLADGSNSPRLSTIYNIPADDGTINCTSDCPSSYVENSIVPVDTDSNIIEEKYYDIYSNSYSVKNILYTEKNTININHEKVEYINIAAIDTTNSDSEYINKIGWLDNTPILLVNNKNAHKLIYSDITIIIKKQVTEKVISYVKNIPSLFKNIDEITSEVSHQMRFDKEERKLVEKYILYLWKIHSNPSQLETDNFLKKRKVNM